MGRNSEYPDEPYQPTEVYRGVEISSRWALANEHATMRKILDDLPDIDRARIKAIWCDSSCQAWYEVWIKPELMAPSLVASLSKVARNGLVLRTETNQGNGMVLMNRIDLGCDWHET